MKVDEARKGAISVLPLATTLTNGKTYYMPIFGNWQFEAELAAPTMTRAVPLSCRTHMEFNRPCDFGSSS